MPTFGNIDGEESATVTFSVRTVKQDIGSTTEQMEILVVGDPESSVAIARVSSVAPKSTDAGLNVRIIGGPSTITDFAIRAILPSTAADNVINVNALPANSSLVQVNAIAAGYLSTAVPAANSSGLNVWSVGGNISSLSTGHVTVDTGSISLSAIAPAYLSTAVPAGNSSGLNTWLVGGNISSLSTGHVTVDTGSISLSAIAAAYVSTAVPAANSSGLNTWIVGANRINIGSTAADNAAVVTVGGNLQSTAAPAAGSSGLNVWVVGGNRLNIGSTAADNAALVTIGGNLQSTAVPAAGSSGLNVWMVGGNRINIGSTAADNAAVVTIGGNLQSTVAPSSNSSALVVRPVIDAITAFATTSALAATVVEVASSVASVRTYVTAYTITSTNQTAAQWGFFSSNGTLLWPMTIAAISSAVSGVNLAVAPPGYLFRTAASDALNFKTGGSTVSLVHLGVSFFRAP